MTGPGARVFLKGVRTRAEGRGLLAQIELRVRAGKPGLDDGDLQPETKTSVQNSMGPLMTIWLDSLSNRNARNDRKRAEAHLVPRWR